MVVRGGKEEAAQIPAVAAKNIVSLLQLGHKSLDQERKSSLNIKSLGRMSCGRPRGYPGGHPGPITFTPSLGVHESQVFRADILDQKARTSMNRGGLVSEKLLCRKQRADFSVSMEDRQEKYTNKIKEMPQA